MTVGVVGFAMTTFTAIGGLATLAAHYSIEVEREASEPTSSDGTSSSPERENVRGTSPQKGCRHGQVPNPAGPLRREIQRG